MLPSGYTPSALNIECTGDVPWSRKIDIIHGRDVISSVCTRRELFSRRQFARVSEHEISREHQVPERDMYSLLTKMRQSTRFVEAGCECNNESYSMAAQLFQ